MSRSVFIDRPGPVPVRPACLPAACGARLDVSMRHRLPMIAGAVLLALGVSAAGYVWLQRALRPIAPQAPAIDLVTAASRGTEQHDRAASVNPDEPACMGRNDDRRLG